MNNTTFHLSTRPHPHLLMMPNQSALTTSSNNRLLPSTDSPFNMTTNSSHSAFPPPTAQMSHPAFSFNNPSAFSYFNFAGLHSMMPMNFGMFPQHHSMFPKSAGMTSPVSGFFTNFNNPKDDDLWNKRSPSNLPESPHSGSRGSPMDCNRKRLCKSRSLLEHNTCPICGQHVNGKALLEHLEEEIKSYLHAKTSGRDSPADIDGSAAVRQQAQVSSSTADSHSRLDVLARVKVNRASRSGTRYESTTSTRPASSHSHSSSAAAEMVSHNKRTRRRSRSSTARRSESPLRIAEDEEEELIVDVVAETAADRDHHDSTSSSSPNPPPRSCNTKTPQRK